MKKTILISKQIISQCRNLDEKNCGNCPYAIALEKATGVKWGVSRSGAKSKRDPKGKFPEYQRIKFDEETTRIIDKWDSEFEMSPHTLEVELYRV